MILALYTSLGIKTLLVSYQSIGLGFPGGVRGRYEGEKRSRASRLSNVSCKRLTYSTYEAGSSQETRRDLSLQLILALRNPFLTISSYPQPLAFRSVYSNSYRNSRNSFLPYLIQLILAIAFYTFQGSTKAISSYSRKPYTINYIPVFSIQSIQGKIREEASPFR